MKYGQSSNFEIIISTLVVRKYYVWSQWFPKLANFENSQKPLPSVCNEGHRYGDDPNGYVSQPVTFVWHNLSGRTGRYFNDDHDVNPGIIVKRLTVASAMKFPLSISVIVMLTFINCNEHHCL